MGKTSRRGKRTGGAKLVAAASHRPAAWRFFYFDPAFKTPKGESLFECVSKYGVGGWTSESKDMATALVFLSDARDASHSWLLGLKRHSTNAQGNVKQYENAPKISPHEGFGEQLSVLLAAASFDALQ